MVAVRVSTVGVEVATESPPQAQVNRQTSETVVDQAGSAAVVIVSTVGAEVAAAVLGGARVNRLTPEAVVDQAGSGAVVIVSTVGVEVAGQCPPQVAVNRLTPETVVDDAGAGATVIVSTVGIEIAALSGVLGPTPLALAAGLDAFMHNWATEVEMETSFETDVSRSRETGAEERRGLMERPERVVTVRWLQQDVAAIDRLVTTLRRMTGTNIQLPLYQDMSLVTQDSTSTTLWVAAATRRYFNQGRVVVFPSAGQIFLSSALQILEIDTPFPDRLTLDAGTPISGTLTAGDFACAPYIDLEIHLEPKVQMRSIRVGDVVLEAREFKGKSSLPPVVVGLPAGWEIELDRPVFEIAPDEAGGVATSYRRYGALQKQGRKQRTFVEGTRYNQVQEYDLLLDRQDFSRVLTFFESRKGRLNAFWTVDREFIWTVIDTDPTFIDVSPLGVFADFDDLWTEQNIAAGIVMNDGTIFLRQINTVQDQGGTWRLTLVAGPTLPTIDVSQIQRFARARLTRFDQDAMTERWASINVCRLRLRTVEVQQEKTIDIDS